MRLFDDFGLWKAPTQNPLIFGGKISRNVKGLIFQMFPTAFPQTTFSTECGLLWKTQNSNKLLTKALFVECER